MKTYKILFFAWILTMAIFVPQSMRAQDVTQLKKAYENLQAKPDNSVAEQAFFAAYPKNFFELKVCFGFSPYLKNNLYDKYVDYFKAFSHLKTIDKKVLYRRAIDVVLGGHWEADMVSEHKGFIEQEMKNNPTTFFSLLSQLTPSQQILFWQFYWESPVKDKHFYDDLMRYLQLKGFEQEKKIMCTVFPYFMGELPIVN